MLISADQFFPAATTFPRCFDKLETSFYEYVICEMEFCQLKWQVPLQLERILYFAKVLYSSDLVAHILLILSITCIFEKKRGGALQLHNEIYAEIGYSFGFFSNLRLKTFSNLRLKTSAKI